MKRRGFIGVAGGIVAGGMLPAVTRLPVLATATAAGPIEIDSRRGPRDVLQRVKSHGIRMVWASSADETVVGRLKAGGFNAVTFTAALLQNAEVVNPAPNAPMLEGTQFVARHVADLAGRADECARQDMLFFPHIMQLSADEWPHLEGKTYRRTVNGRGIAGDRAPCPLDRRIWFEFQLPRMLTLAEIMAKSGCAGGIMLEAETYAAHDIYPGYHGQKHDLCYCGHCWAHFLEKLTEAQRPRQVIDPTGRYPWLSSRGMLWDYEQHMRQELAKTLRELAAEVRKVMPDVLFGLYPASITWFNDALIESLGTPELPFIVYCRSEYYPGFSTYPDENMSHMYSSADHLRHLKTLGLPCLYLGGLMVGHHWPHRMGLEIASLQRKADGVWIFPSRNIRSDLRGEVVMRESAGRHAKMKLDAAPFLAKVGEANAMIAAWPRRHAAAPAQGRAMTLWNDVDIDGPASEPLVWDASNPPTPEAGWLARMNHAGDAQGVMPRVDPEKRAFLFDLNASSSAPKATTLDYSFKQPAKQAWLWSVEVKYEGGPSGARVSLRRSNGRHINALVYAGDGWVKLRQLLPAHPEDEDRWVRFIVHPSDGRLWVRRMQLAPCSTTTLQSDRLVLAPGRTWGCVNWELADGGDGMTVVDVYGGDGVRPLYTGLENGFDLGDISRIWGMKEVEVEARFIMPAGSFATLVRFDIVGAGKPLPSRRPLASRAVSPTDP